MPLYTFYPCKPDGTAVSLEAVELTSDGEAISFAEKLLVAHATCAFITVWEDERLVSTCHRAAGLPRAMMAAADVNR